jgi:pimeloyl-ACP methyl ester carboxylesterase
MPYLNVNDERIYYALHCGKADRHMPVLLIHGAGENHLVWPAGLRRLPDTTVYALDLPGHGKSGGSGRCTVTDYVEWIRAFLDAIDARQAILIGHSMGGAITLLFGLMYPDRAAGLVLVASGAKLRVAPKLLELAKNDLPAAAEMVSRLEWGPNAPAQLVLLGKRQLLTNQLAVIYGDYHACDVFDVIDRLSQIAAPTLIIAGTADQMTPIKYATFMAERIPHARLVSIPAAGHMVMLEAETSVACEVEQFLREIKPEE